MQVAKNGEVTTNNEEPLYTGYVYMIYNDINSKVYIGETLSTIATRFKQHIWKAFDKNRKYDGKLFRAIRKYGKGHFFIKEIDKVIGLDRTRVKEEIQKLEVLYISKYDSCKNGYNCDFGGGKGAKIPSEETRLKQSLIKKSNPKYAEIARINQKKSLNNNKIPITMYDFYSGKKLEEFESTKAAAIKYSKEASSITKICKGKTNYLRIQGQKVTFKYQQDLYLPKYIVECYTENLGVVEKFVEIAYGANKYGSDPSAVIRCCKGKNNYAGKYHGEFLKWRYIKKGGDYDS